jgi:hypothetical protein
VELALGHTSSDEDISALGHVAACPRCREELKLTTRVVAAARGAEPSDLPAAPPERVWQRIAHELSHEADQLPHSGRNSVRRSEPERVCGVRRKRAVGAGRHEGLLVLGLVAVVLLVRWLRFKAGRGRDRRSGRRLPPP